MTYYGLVAEAGEGIVRSDAVQEGAVERLGGRRDATAGVDEGSFDLGQAVLRCGACGKTVPVSQAAEKEQAEGWPKCCGETMGMAAQIHEGGYGTRGRRARMRRRKGRQRFQERASIVDHSKPVFPPRGWEVQ